MKPAVRPFLRSHLADFETTTSHLLAPGEAVALLNFAALLHEVIYLTDTALGDHELILRSFIQERHSGLFFHITRLIEKGILRILCRNKVVVGDKVLTPRDPTLCQIFEGWKYRDKAYWSGETGFTTVVNEDVRRAYYRELDNLLTRYNARHPYDPDIPKTAFRDKVREQLHSERPSMLAKSLAGVPDELLQQYLKAIQDSRFTNAELWRVLKRAPQTNHECIILHAHINQQCFADLTAAGLSGHDRTSKSLASFNLELQRRRPLALDLDVTIEPPRNLDGLLERAAIRFSSFDIQMFEHLSVEDVVALRRRATPIFELARTQIQPHEVHNIEKLHHKYLKALHKYWSHIIDTFQAKYPEKLLRPNRVGLFLERELPTLDWLYRKFGKSIFAIPFRLALEGPAGAASDSGLLHRLGVMMLQEHTTENQKLRRKVPPVGWARGIFSLDRTGPTCSGRQNAGTARLEK
jgi:hypothetical protein